MKTESRKPRCECDKPFAHGKVSGTSSPLTPLRGEGGARRARRDWSARLRVLALGASQRDFQLRIFNSQFSILNFQTSSWTGRPRTRQRAICLPHPSVATPSPLNGERAGVRGENRQKAGHFEIPAIDSRSSDVRTVHPHYNPRSPRRTAAFSLIEMIGVLAIIAIVAAIITPNLARRISRANGDKEDAALAVLADGLIRSVRTTQIIPGAGSWTTNIAAQIGLSVNEVRYVNPADTASGRVFLIHPSFTPTNASGSDPLWTQGASGASVITNAKILIVSSHKSSLSLPVSSGRASSAAVFDAIWDWNFNATNKAPPSSWPAGWTDNGEYLHVQRVNLSPLFYLATFSNQHHPTNYPYYQVGSAAASSMSSTNILSAYYLEGSMLRVYFTNGTTLHLTHTLRNGVNFVYESSRWRIP